MANWKITQTQQVGNTTINTWQNVPSLADIQAEFNRKQAQRLTQRVPDECPRGGFHKWGDAISPDTLEICEKCGTRR